MPPERLAEITARWAAVPAGEPYWVTVAGTSQPGVTMTALSHAGEDVPALVAEVERLRSLLHDVQRIARDRMAEARGRKAHGEQLAARVAELEREVAAARAERDIEIVVWLGKKAREYRSTGSAQHKLQADAVEVMASKIARGAVAKAGESL
jgi:hypothetical protein